MFPVPNTPLHHPKYYSLHGTKPKLDARALKHSKHFISTSERKVSSPLVSFYFFLIAIFNPSLNKQKGPSLSFPILNAPASKDGTPNPQNPHYGPLPHIHLLRIPTLQSQPAHRAPPPWLARRRAHVVRPHHHPPASRRLRRAGARLPRLCRHVETDDDVALQHRGHDGRPM